MACPCCRPQCPIQEIASSVQITFGASRTDLSVPIFAGGSGLDCYRQGNTLRYCPLGNLGFGYNYLDTNFNKDATSGDCSKYDGTYIVDLQGSNVNTSAYFLWCTVFRADACEAAGKRTGPFAMGNSVAYSVSCNGVVARQMKMGQSHAIEFVASLVSVTRGSSPPPSPPESDSWGQTVGGISSPPLSIVSGPQKVAETNIFDWYMTRYSRGVEGSFLRFPGNFDSYSLYGPLGHGEQCDLQAPQIILA